MIIGLTGQSGAGKTTVCKVFMAEGFAVINCDIVARKVTSNGSECNKRLSEVFPKCIDANLSLNRPMLAKEVFGNKKSLQKLNDTIFPFITNEILHQINILKNEGEKYIILDAPTLFESGAYQMCDIIISCIANEDTRIKRISSRDKIEFELIRSRFLSQHSEEYFKEKSDYIIENNSDITDAQLQAKIIADIIKERI